MAAVGADPRVTGTGVGVGADSVNSHPSGRARMQVTDEDVLARAAVSGHQIIRPRSEGNVATVAADGREKAGLIGVAAGGVDAGPRRGPGP
jgi:hypothetical protein